MAGPNDFGTIVTALLTTENTLGKTGFLASNGDTTVVAMLVGAGLESDWRINAPGGGAFQIIDKVGFDPTDIQSAVNYMWPRYQAAAGLDAVMPEGADKYADIAYKAERPAVPYAQSQGEAKVQAVYQTVMQNYGTPGATAQAPVDSVNPLTSGVSSLLSWITTPANWVRIAEVGLGAAVLIVGLHAVFTNNTVTGSARTVSGHVKTAAKFAAFA